MTEGFMRSALDRAMERAEQIEVPEDRLREMEFSSKGTKIAALFLKETEYNLSGAIDQYEAKDRDHIIKSVESVLLQNLLLPRKEGDKIRNAKVMEGLYVLKTDKQQLAKANEQFENLSNYYQQARTQNHEQLKAEFERITRQAIKQQTGIDSNMAMKVEQSPEFQEKWRQISGQLDTQYDKVMTELRQSITQIG